MQLQIQCLIFAILPQAKFLLEAAGVLSHSLAPGLRLNLLSSLFLSSSRTSAPMLTVVSLSNCLNPISKSSCGQPSHAPDPRAGASGAVLGWERAAALTAELGVQQRLGANQQYLTEQTLLVSFFTRHSEPRCPCPSTAPHVASPALL